MRNNKNVPSGKFDAVSIVNTEDKDLTNLGALYNKPKVHLALSSNTSKILKDYQVEEEETSAAPLENVEVNSDHADALEWFAPTEKSTYVLAQVAEGLVAAGAGAVGVGAGVTGLGLGGSAGAVVSSLGVAGMSAGAIVTTIGSVATGTSAIVASIASVNYLITDDKAPAVTAEQSFSYQENVSADFAVGTVMASDNIAVTGFRFAATGTSTSADRYFSIGAKGAVTLTAAGAAAGVASNDFETGANSFTYGVQARDAAGNWSASSSVTFALTDAEDTMPTVTPAQSLIYAENSSANASVGTVAAADNVGVTGYRFTGTVDPSTSADGYFSIGANGAVTLTAAGAAAGVASNDFETGANSFTYGVQARDATGNWSASTSVTFNLRDVDETAPTVSPTQSFFYEENRSVNAIVGTVAAADNVGVTGYRFTGTVDPSTSADGYFSIGANGAVTLTAAGAAAGVASNDFDIGANSFNYFFQARDAAGNWSASTKVWFYLRDVDETAPTVTPAQSFFYEENRSVNAIVGTVAAADNVGVTGYRFTGTVDPSTSADGYFSIGANGAVTLTAAGAAAGVASNDFDTGANSFTYGVQARDAAGNWSASTSVTFNLRDVDETAPTVTPAQSFFYEENSSANAIVATVAAADNVGVTGYRFTGTVDPSTSADGYFSIGANGAVTLTAAGAAAGVASNDFDIGANSFNYFFQARDAVGNWSASTEVTFNLTSPLVDDWSDGYDSDNYDWLTTGLVGPLSFTVSSQSEGNIEVAGDLDIFGTTDEFGGAATQWWNGVYLITVDATGDHLNASELYFRLLDPQGIPQDDPGMVAYDESTGLLSYEHNQSSQYLMLEVGAKDGKTGSYSLSIDFIDDYADRIHYDEIEASPIYGVGIDETSDLGFGSVALGSPAEGVFNSAADVDIWKYSDTDASVDEFLWVDVSQLGGGSLTVFDYAGRELQANVNGRYTLTGDTYLHVASTPGIVGSSYSFEVNNFLIT